MIKVSMKIHRNKFEGFLTDFLDLNFVSVGKCLKLGSKICSVIKVQFGSVQFLNSKKPLKFKYEKPVKNSSKSKILIIQLGKKISYGSLIDNKLTMIRNTNQKKKKMASVNFITMHEIKVDGTWPLP